MTTLIIATVFVGVALSVCLIGWLWIERASK